MRKFEWSFILFASSIVLITVTALGWILINSYQADKYCIHLGYEGARGIAENVKGEEWIVCTLRTIENKTVTTLEHWLPYKP